MTYKNRKHREWRTAAVIAAVTMGVVVALLTLPSRAAPAADADGALPDPREMERVEASIDKALEYLRKHQQPDGSWPSSGNREGINAFCLLAFLGRGHEPGRGPYKDVVDRAVTHLLSVQIDTGFFPVQMYDHGLCTLALTEAYGFIPSPSLRKQIQKAVDLIVKSQNAAGGWRYNPQPADADLSVTVMQIVALRSAQNARLEVPQTTIDNAIKYVKMLAAPAGGFGYASPSAGPATSAGGTLSLQLLGQWDDPKTLKGLDYMKTNRAAYAPGQAWFFYANYYAMQAHFQAGGDYWADWHPKVRDALLTTQAEDGSWPGQAEQAYNGPAQCYSTAVGAMCLEVYLHYLPAYQR
ncbi:MAG: terpene cyclase/mutase family protein [Phycisphaeraceae bacterium]|nr:terpene cyclase/mutase family protein [Phycisphaeraceae bacterium]